MSAITSSVEHKDVILALLGAAAGLAGLALVFLGLVVRTIQEFDRPTPAAVLDPYRRVALMILGAFTAGMACVAVATVWLVGRGESEALYVATIALFGLLVVALLVATGWTVFRLIWKG